MSQLAIQITNETWQGESARRHLNESVIPLLKGFGLKPEIAEIPAEPLSVDAESELANYVGSPRCPDCKWKLGTDITDNCSCNPTGDPDKYDLALSRARELQRALGNNAEVSRPTDKGVR